MSKVITGVALAVLMLLVVALPASAITTVKNVEVRGTVANASALSSDLGNSSVSWNAESFAGFWYDLKDNKSTESLKILRFKAERDIDKEYLWYNTSMSPIKYKVNKEKNRTVEYGLSSTASTPYTSTSTGGEYYNVTGWFAAKYVAINGKNNKLSKLIYEQPTADKKTMAIGETWDLGEGYTLTAQSIDAKASPRQAWLVLNKDGNKLDDKIIEAASSTGTGTQGVYTYYANIGGESNVPIFVTYVDSVFAGATSDMVQLRYTWLVSNSVTEVKSGDKYGIFKVDSTSGPLTLKSDNSVTLSKDGKVDLAGDMKFRVSDTDSGDVRFYPMVEYQIGETTEVTPTPGGTATPARNVTPTPPTNVTPIVTTPPAQTPTKPPEATPTPTKKAEPGFESALAITGLLAVAYLVLRQRK